MSNRVFASIAFLVLALIPAICASAHQVGFSSLRVVVRDDGVDTHMAIPVADLENWNPPAIGVSAEQNRAALVQRVEKEAGSFLDLRENYSPVTADSANAVFVPEMSAVRLTMRWAGPPAGPITAVQYYSNHLGDLPDPHRQNVIVIDVRGIPKEKIGPLGEGGRVIARHTLTTAAMTAFDNIPPAGAGTTDVAGPDGLPTTQRTVAATKSPRTQPITSPEEASFIKLGIEHILTGYDHLLFLAALLLVCRTFKEAAAIITCFTLAHSITLALAALNIVSLSPSVVEPLIAATIVYVAIENLFVKQQHLYWRMGLTFGFGLVHGLGFASALRDAGLGSDPRGILIPLVKFNGGVEAGQLAVAVVIFPIFLLIRRNPKLGRASVLLGSSIIVLFGAFWFIQRVWPGLL